MSFGVRMSSLVQGGTRLYKTPGDVEDGRVHEEGEHSRSETRGTEQSGNAILLRQEDLARVGRGGLREQGTYM